jgi:hypothetical protein
MLDADAPVTPRHGTTAEPHVAAGIDGEVAQAGLVHDVGGTVDGPAFDEPRRIEPTGGTHVEVAARLEPKLVAPLEHVADVGVCLFHRELAALDALDLAVLPVSAERLVDPAEPCEHIVDQGGVCVVADVDDDRHPHDVFDVSGSGRGSGCESAHARFALRIAACSD